MHRTFGAPSVSPARRGKTTRLDAALDIRIEIGIRAARCEALVIPCPIPVGITLAHLAERAVGGQIRRWVYAILTLLATWTIAHLIAKPLLLIGRDSAALILGITFVRTTLIVVSHQFHLPACL